MNVVDFEYICQQRLKADTGSGGLYSGGGGALNTSILGSEIRTQLAPPGTVAYPYLVIRGEYVQNDTAQDDAQDATLRIYIVDAMANGLAAARIVARRVYGNAMTNGGTPGHGFHRHILGSLGSGLGTGSQVLCVAQHPVFEDENHNIYEMEFKCHVSATVSGP